MRGWYYSRCSSCPNDHRQVYPDGPRNAKVMLVGEGPGKREDIEGIPFVGRSGQEQDQTYFPLAGLQRSEVFVSNCVQCRQERNGVDAKPDTKLVSVCAQNHLAEEL